MSDARSSSKGTLFGIHYAWIVCIACTLIMYGNNGITGSMFSLYQPFIKDMYGITNTQMSFILTTRSIMSLLAVVVCSFYYKVFSIRIGMLVASILCGGSFLLFGYSETFPMFLLSGVLLGLGSGFGTNIPVSMALRLWFNKKRKLAMSITVLAGSVGLLGLPSVLTNIIEGVSLRAGFTVNAAIVFAVTVIAPVAVGAYYWFFGASYQQERLRYILMDPQESGAGYVPLMIRQFLEGSRMAGAGTGTTPVELTRIPEIQNFILSGVIAYYGILAAVIFVGVMLFLLMRFLKISLGQRNQLGMLMGAGCSVLFLVEAAFYLLENLGVIYIGTFCPFLSYGGTGTMVTYILLGLLLSIYRYQNTAPERKRAPRISRNPV